jgi:hypothetical protein
MIEIIANHHDLGRIQHFENVNESASEVFQAYVLRLRLHFQNTTITKINAYDFSIGQKVKYRNHTIATHMWATRENCWTDSYIENNNALKT